MEQTYDLYNQFQEGIIFSLLFSGREECLPNHHYRGIRNHFLLHYIEKGSGTVGSSPSNSTLLEEGNCFLYPPHSMIYYQASRNDPWTYRWLAFSAGQKQRLLSMPGSSHPILFNSTAADGILSLITGIENQFRKKTRESSMASEKLLMDILCILLNKSFDPSRSSRAMETEDVFDKPNYIQAAEDYIRLNYQMNINTQIVADYIGLNRSYFSRMFSNETGTTLQDYLIHIRMKEACRLLTDTNFTVQAVASSVGYDEYAVFSRRFKAVIGVSAGEWRRLKQKNNG